MRRIWVEVKGKMKLVEDLPDLCHNRHQVLRPGWSRCPDCGYADRSWTCGQSSCPPVIHDEHVCRY